MALGSDSSVGGGNLWVYILSAVFILGMTLWGILWLQPKLTEWYPDNNTMVYVWMTVFALGSGLLYYYIVLPGLTKMF